MRVKCHICKQGADQERGSLVSRCGKKDHLYHSACIIKDVLASKILCHCKDPTHPEALDHLSDDQNRYIRALSSNADTSRSCITLLGCEFVTIASLFKLGCINLPVCLCLSCTASVCHDEIKEGMSQSLASELPAAIRGSIPRDIPLPTPQELEQAIAKIKTVSSKKML